MQHRIDYNTMIFMKKKLALQQRILILYVAFFATIIASFCFGTFGSGLAKGLRDGFRVSDQIANEQAEGNPNYWIGVYYDLPSADADIDIDLNNPALHDGTKLKARINSVDLMAENPNTILDGSMWKGLTTLMGTPAIFICSWLLVIGYAVIVVMMFLIIRSLRRSIKSESVFDRKNFVRTRTIGLLLIGCSFMSALINYLTINKAAQLLEGSCLMLNTSFSVNFWDVLMGILILLIAEAFAIGYDMSQEQKLTI